MAVKERVDRAVEAFAEFKSSPDEGLIDEYRFVVGPTLAGAGRRLLEGVSLPEKLQEVPFRKRLLPP